jgi:hypothetical protein
MLRFRFLDPMLSALSIPLPGIEYRLMGATRRRIFHSAAPADLSPAGFSFLEERTKEKGVLVVPFRVFRSAA